LSFSEEFFTDASIPDDTKPSARPSTVYQAIISLDKRRKVDIAREVLACAHPVLAVMSSSFAVEVLEKVRATNTCSDLTGPVKVWIDPEGWYTVTVY
jgi:hypothetical protein